MIVRDWMSAPWVALPAERTLPEALRFMHERGAAGVTVTKDGRVLGAVARGEIFEALERGDPSTLLSRTTLSSLVASGLPPVLADDPIERAAQILADRSVSALPVVSNHIAVGVFTPQDVIRAFCSVMGARGREPLLTLIFTAPRGCDVLEEIRRRAADAQVHSVLAYPMPGTEWQVHLRVRRAVSSPAGVERCA